MTRRSWALLLALFVAAWLPRALALDAFVTPDERKWLARSANFYQAVSHGDLANTFQREHPGVPVMWAGTLGFLQRFPRYATEAPGQFGWDVEHLEAWLLENTSHTPLEMLAAGRWWITLAIALALAASFLPLRTLLGEGRAALALLVVAWEPFHVALSRQLHPDGLAASLLFLALVLFLAWLYGGRARRPLVASGIVLGLATLTKSPSAILLPVAGLLVLAAGWREQGEARYGIRDTGWGLPLSQGTLRALRSPLLASTALWGLLALATFVALWPAMWVDPLDTLVKMAAETSDYVEGHVNANFFLGAPTEDPGPLFYPVAFLFRATPFVLAGLVAAGVAAWRRRAPFDDGRVRRTAGALALFALLFALVITVGAKKFDRYALPLFPPLAVVAALGWLALAHAITSRLPQSQIKNRKSKIALVALLLSHAIFLPATFPYYLTYYNPLVGGSRTAPHTLFVGWGEGLDEAAAWLNAQPGAEALRVAAWYADGPFSYFFRGRSEVLTNFSPLVWLDTDFAVLYVNQWQRENPSPEALAWFDAREPAFVARADGLELARVYDLRDAPLPDFIEWTDERRADFGGKIRLVGYRLEQTVAQPGDRFQVTLYERSLAPMTHDYNVLVRLVGPDGAELWRSEGWPWGAPTSDWPVRDSRPDGHVVQIPADAPPGLYALRLSFYDPATFEPLPITEAASPQPTGEVERLVDFVRVGPAPHAARALAPTPLFGDVARLRAVTLPERTTAGKPLPIELEWESVGPTSEDYTVFVHLVPPGEPQPLAQADRPPLDGFAPTHAWDPGETFLDALAVELPPDVPPGRYELRVGLYTAAGRLPVSPSPAPDYAVIGTVDVE